MLFEGVWVFGLIVSGPGLISSVGLGDGGGASGLCVRNGSALGYYSMGFSFLIFLNFLRS